MGACFSKKKTSSSSSSSYSCLNLPAAAAIINPPPPGPGGLPLVDPAAAAAANNNNDDGDDGQMKKMINKKKIFQEEEGAVKMKKKTTTKKEDIPLQEEDLDGNNNEGFLVKKEIFVIKHRKSHDRDINAPRSCPSPKNKNTTPSAEPAEVLPSVAAAGNNNNNNNVVRTSSCTKEEVDAILIQCGRLSRSNSSGATAGKASSGLGGASRKYSGSKRSYDFDHNDQDAEKEPTNSNDDQEAEAPPPGDRRQHRHRQSSRVASSSSSSQGRRRTPSRERDQNQQQRSGSRERASGSGSGRRVSRSPGRRVSRSPGRRSETTQTTSSMDTSNGNANASSNNNAAVGGAAGNINNNRPGKMVSVPATVSSLAMDKSNSNGVDTQTVSAIKRISVKRNVGDAAAAAVGSRTAAASPRSQSPARTNNQQQPSLSRSSSRKAEHSPCRRNPLSEIDPNSLAYPQANGNKANINNSKPQPRNNKEIEGQIVVKESINVQNQGPAAKQNAEMTNRVARQGTNCRADNKLVKEQQQMAEDVKGLLTMTGNISRTPVVVSAAGAENLGGPHGITRSRSSRRSRDLDFDPGALLNPPNSTSYTALLLEDIQNFHQKNNNPPASFSLPACVSKACSILEAVADLNSTTSSSLSCAFSEDRRSPPAVSGASLAGKKLLSEAKDPFVESEILASNDLMEPSFHKYVTVKRGGALCMEDMDGQESSGSNSVVGGSQQQHWGGYSTSSWEPNSADSTDRWTSRSNTREEDDKSPLGGFQMQHGPLSEPGRLDMEEARRGFSGQRTGIGRGRLGNGNSIHTTPINIATAAAST